MSETYSLLVWEEIPDRTRFVLIPNSWMTEEKRKIFQIAANHHINSTDTTPEQEQALNHINLGLEKDYVSNDVDDYYSYVPREWHGALHKWVLDDSGSIENTHITHVYRSGFFL
jgi:hypothetical protein